MRGLWFKSQLWQSGFVFVDVVVIVVVVLVVFIWITLSPMKKENSDL